MPDILVTVTGAKELQAKLNKLSNVGAVLKPPMIKSAQEVLQTMKRYPAATEANRPPNPPPGTYYERGKGTWYVRAGAIIKRDKRSGLRRVTNKGGKKLISSSQMLNRSWSVRYTFFRDHAEAIIGTRVTYAPYVHDREHQARFHARRGWQTVQTVVHRLEKQITARFEAAIAAALR